ncbi:DUF547 domain-containing protein [Aporhodopirellula aestuarii]|uniref:DUF547 domain-containing protein n=1 Tax=Aporhodopirellula aestuarii TaxID=2950107 RepID=A0ABT0U014_9BACT|nr:DUF547 domain-containing protein [Aporhodopirellula aestuarii]MCM2370204.1 DUF547 domain-containing protein [Aporhodopirellula aestuarii]
MKLLSNTPIALTVLPALLAIWSATPCLGGTKVHLGQNVPESQRLSMDQIDHQDWNTLLKRYVDANGNVNYTAWQSSAADVQTLDRYLAQLSAAAPQSQTSDAARLAFWINAYNAVTIRGILREYPTTSIRNHTAKLFGYNIWKDLLLTVGGEPYSLDQIEHQLLRKLGEPRIHFAIVCASRSCPRLMAEAYTADKLEFQLTSNTKAFFANSGNFRYNPARQTFHLSSILDWFGEDFGRDDAALLRTIAPYLPTREAYDAAMTVSSSPSLSYLAYDWRLNDQATAATPSRPN